MYTNISVQYALETHYTIFRNWLLARPKCCGPRRKSENLMQINNYKLVQNISKTWPSLLVYSKWIYWIIICCNVIS